jgi:hypothetical protein
VSHFKATTLLGGARKSTVFFGIKAEICGPPNVSFQQLVDSRDIAKSVLDASSKRINVKFYKHLPAPSGTPSYYLSGSWRFPSSPRVSSVGTFAQPIEPSFAVPGIFWRIWRCEDCAQLHNSKLYEELVGDSVQILELVEAYWRMDAKALRMNTLVAKARKEETSETGMKAEIDSLFAFADKDVVLVQKIRLSLVARPSHVDR